MIKLDDIESVEVIDDFAMSGWDDIDPLNNKAGYFYDSDGNKHIVELNDPHALKLANEQKTDGVFQFDTDLAKCCKYDSKISLKDCTKQIDQLNPQNDKILYLSKTGPKMTNNYEVKMSGYKEVKKITLDDGRILCLTDKHAVLTRNGYVKVSELTIDDEIVEIDHH